MLLKAAREEEVDASESVQEVYEDLRPRIAEDFVSKEDFLDIMNQLLKHLGIEDISLDLQAFINNRGR